MRTHRTLPFLVAIALLAAGVPTPAANIPNDAGAIHHALSRLTFGARTGDADRVSAMGLTAWIERQLAPSSIDDAALASRLPALPEPPLSFASQQEARQFGRQSVQVLAASKIVRAVHSERQLEEILVDFWFNHFNVFAGKGRTGLYVPDYEREAIRPHVLGRFRDLLGATAKSPAMLFYLDNWLSADPREPDAAATRRRPNRAAQAVPNATNQRRRGLNENYARELLELHTLGVDGGYTQDDIINVARAFTGWTIERPEAALALRASSPQRPSGFRFAPALHDTGAKTLLGERLPAGDGIRDGERVLDIVAAHPSTARHIATKLARRFVSDDPPDALIARTAARFRETGGDLREVVRTVIMSPEFFAAEARRAKVKTPLEFVASAMRATGRDVTDARPLLQGLRQLGMMPYMCEPPTGYGDDAESWISAGALVTRMNIAQQIARADAATIGGPDFQRR
jgi:uncharacterized protein (DUF1800 family)